MKPHALTLSPQRCDKCMHCVRVCPRRAIEGTGGFVLVDWARCDGCGKCVDVCVPGAIARGKGAAIVSPKTAAATRAAEEVTSAAAGTPTSAVAAAPVETSHSEAATATAAVPAASPVARDATPVAEQVAPASEPGFARETPFSADWKGWEVAFVLLGLLALFAVRQAAWNSAWMTEVVIAGARPLMRAGVLMLYYALQLAMLAALGFRKGVGFSEAFGLRRVHVNAFGAVVGLFLFTRLFQLAFGTSVTLLGWKDPGGPTSSLTSYFGRDALGFWLTLLMVVVVGPLFEELIFRGVLLNYLTPRTGASFGVIASSLLFATYHFNAWAFVPVAVMGAAAGWLATSRRSLWPAYALHASYNAIAVVLAFWLVGR